MNLHLAALGLLRAGVRRDRLVSNAIRYHVYRRVSIFDRKFQQ